MNVNIRHIKIENIDTSYSFQDCETKQSVDGSSIATLAGLIPDTYYFAGFQVNSSWRERIKTAHTRNGNGLKPRQSR